MRRAREIAALYESGQTMLEIASALGVCKTTVRYYLLVAGARLRPRGRRRK